MGVTIQSGNTSITGNVTAVPSKATATIVSVTAWTNGTQTLGAVGAGKVWRILSANISVSSNGAGAFSSTLKLGAAPILSITQDLAAGTSAANNQSASWGYSACPVLVAGDTITAVGQAAGKGGASVTYVEENA